LLEESPSEHL